jgi:hypothetical protein
MSDRSPRFPPGAGLLVILAIQLAALGALFAAGQALGAAHRALGAAQVALSTCAPPAT